MSWNNDDIISPNMQDMVDSGIKLNQFYTQPTCSPSRAALLTGQYPIHTGFNVRFFTYRKVASSSLSRLVAHFQIFRRLMKGKFDAYVL